jgi:D-alanyl-lipoteichoic acid acyltransferase DltB (MBOAT superfamily)
MALNTASFAVFFAVFYAVYALVLSRPRHKLVALVAGGLSFYAAAGIEHVPLLLLSLAISYGFGLAIERARADRARRRRRLLLGCTLSLGLLAVFKYTGFVTSTLDAALETLGLAHALPALRVVLPVGISFYTFQSVSYLVDVSRRARPAERDLLRFAAWVTFFPPLVAGPIVRARMFLPQLEKLSPPEWLDVRRGILLFALGLAKKTVADLVAPTADALFRGASSASTLDAWTGLLAYAAQMYGDFSGWSDMAIGCAAVLGFALPRNFDLPYLSASPVEVWSRWHISLSTWLRDYLFWPLGTRHPYRSLIVTWTLCGLWHGASWMYVGWGLYWGVLIALTHWLNAHLGERVVPRAAVVVQLPLTFYLWLVGLTLFGAATPGDTLRIVASTVRGAQPSVLDAAAALSLAGVGLALVVPHAVDWLVLRRPAVAERAPILWGLALAGLVFSIAFGEPGQQFIYWRF